ncbi:IclR family transcriptional regulator [Actinomycetospora cinnamomea]|uniref:IclR family transcriptional regulator n=1 Tax=Actinomycetospora cinnamomea TaxID=663609 RepID=A0A2U1EDG8_9PSEU|nr:IclR family transcriptional regulator [Actinomycetospora cinnamomea]PVY98006.1 IclR family transcriptional regulator [Actinomycetospora cinnamomea]
MPRERRPPARTAPGRSATSRALSVLDAFDGGHRTLTLSHIARRAGLPVATAHRLVGELCAARLLSRRPDSRYEIGARVWQLGLLAPPASLREAALPHLQDLVITTGRTVHLAVLDGDRALVVERLASSRTQPTRHRPGGHTALHCTAVGKVLLAHSPPAVRDEALRSPARYTPWTITDPGTIRRQLDAILTSGYAQSAQEHRQGVWSVAMPITGPSGVVAALGVLAPLTAPRLADALSPLSAAATAISASVADVDLGDVTESPVPVDPVDEPAP